ncbi:MAG: Ppx/GppA family phosphatase [Candidatus Marinimicrobia bacterium]|nr:Ppx/GppA family phosphatase [Candidatus Neomarinimicrobiota bacterium]
MDQRAVVEPGCFAAIDLGTNTCLLLVARWDGAELTPLAQELRVVRLGEGVAASGRLTEQAMTRAETAFRDYRKIIAAHGCREVRCVATSAYREATNAAELGTRILRTSGYRLTAISGAEEAALVKAAVEHAFPWEAGSRVIVDVGGGSTEVILQQPAGASRVESLSLGSVRLTEDWLPSDPPTPLELDSAEEHIRSVLDSSQTLHPADDMIGVGGTATTFVAMHQQLDAYDHARIHGATLELRTLRQIMELSAALTFEERQALPGLHPGRADIIIAGGLILAAIMERTGLRRLRVSDHGVRWGLVLEMVSGRGQQQ